MLTPEQLCAPTFDARAVPDATIADISMRLFNDYREQAVDADVIAANNRTPPERLAALRCYDLGKNTPTVAGVLLFGIRPQYFFPGAYVQFLKFPGDTMTERPIDDLAARGDLRLILEVIKHKIIAHNHVAPIQGEGFREKTVSTYPEWAVRELFHNAIMHRNYDSTAPVRFYWFSDRIEIQSPGGLHGEVTAETLASVNSYRNPVIAEAMRSMEYVNRYGYGIQRARQLLKENGNPPPVFEIHDNFFRVTIRPRNFGV